MDIALLGEQFCEYSRSIRGYTPATIRRYKHTIGAFMRFTGITDLTQVTEVNTRALFLYGRTQRNWSVNTYLVYKNSLLVFFRWCVANGYMAVNPVEGIETPKQPKRLPKALSLQSAMKILEIVSNYPYEIKFLRHRNHALFATLIYAGLRKQELLNLKYSDVDIDNLTIFVRGGKGDKDRILPVNHTLAQSLKRYVAERKRLGRTCPEFFVSSNQNHGYTTNGFRLLVRQISKVLGIKFTPHTLRHTFATLMLQGGCDIYSLSKMMGHSDIQTTPIYLSATAEHLRTQISKHPLQ